MNIARQEQYKDLLITCTKRLFNCAFARIRISGKKYIMFIGVEQNDYISWELIAVNEDLELLSKDVTQYKGSMND